MGKSRTLRDALVTDLEAVAGIVTVETEPRDPDKMALPAAMIVPGSGGNSDAAQLSQIDGSTIQEFDVQLVFRSATPNNDALNYLDLVRNRVEVRGSTTRSVAGVEYADVTSWSEVLTDQDVRNQLSMIILTISIKYIYRRGSL